MLTGDKFLADIEAFLRHAGMSATAFGRACARDPNLVSDLRGGRDPRLRLVERVSAFIQSHASEPKQQPGDTTSQAKLGTETLADRAPMGLSGTITSSVAPPSSRKLGAAVTSVPIRHSSGAASSSRPKECVRAGECDFTRTRERQAPETRAFRDVSNSTVTRMGTNHDQP